MLFARVEIRVTECIKKKPKQKPPFWPDFFRNSSLSFPPDFSFCGRGRANIFLGGGGVTSKLAS